MILDFDSRPPNWNPQRPERKQTHSLDGTVSALLALESEPSTETTTPVTQTQLKLKQRERRELEKTRVAEFDRQKSQWNPHKDDNIKGDPSSTLFLARLPYGTKEEQIRTEFEVYGAIESVRIVEPRRGYAFVVFANPEGHEKATSAVQRTAGGTLFQGRRIIIDLERGRLQLNWKPRRLGGGLGGRFSLARQRAEVARSHQIMRRGVSAPGSEAPNSRPPYSAGPQRRTTPYERSNPAPVRAQSHRYPKVRSDTRTDSRSDSRGGSRFRNSDSQFHAPRREDKSGNSGGRTLRQY